VKGGEDNVEEKHMTSWSKFYYHPIAWFEQQTGIKKMAQAQNVTVSADKPQYSPGDTVTLNISWASGEQISTTEFNVSVSVKNQNGEEATASAQLSVATSAPNDTFTVDVTDDGNHTWNVEMGSDGLSAIATTTV
jgi:phage gp45-like